MPGLHSEQFIVPKFPDPTTYSSTLTSPAMVVTQQTPALFKPIKVGRMALQHRVVLAPLTRFRAYASHVPGPQQASYYAQRGSTPGSLLITEATFMSHDAGAYVHVPGIYTEEQIQAWKTVRSSFCRPFSSYLTACDCRSQAESMPRDPILSSSCGHWVVPPTQMSSRTRTRLRHMSLHPPSY